MSDLADRIASWVREARRRKVWVSIGAYLLVSVTIIELSGSVFEALLLPDWSSRLVTVLLILGFPVVVVLAWIFDVGPGGVHRTESPGGHADPSGDGSGAHGGRGGGGGDARRDGGVGTAARPVAPRRSTPTVRRVSPSSGPSPSTATAPPLPEEVPEPAEPPDPERVKRAALGHVRHELKTPINAILGYSEMLLEDLEEEDDAPGELIEDLGKVREAGRRLLSEVDRILDPARIERGGEAVDLDEAGARIRADLRNPVSAVVGYAELLAENAEEAGRGYMVPDLERIRDAGRTLLERSTDIVRIATDHVDATDGRISEASAITEGVLARAGAASKGVAGDAAGSLLVVDDNAMNRDLLSRQLARAGYVVQTASGGREALDRLSERAYDLVLLDVIMPEMDGLEVLRRVKSDGDLARTPVIMLSSLDDVESAIRCVELGAEDFLSKPFHPTLLNARIGATLGVRRLEDRIAVERDRLRDAEAFSERLLRSSFPESIAERVRGGESEIVESYEAATVLWCDVEAAARRQTRDPAVVADRLRRILGMLERVSAEHDLEAMVPAGDGMALAGGVPTPVEDHADRVAAAALALRDALADDGLDTSVRLGVDSGAVTGAVLGGERLGFRLWGEALDLARALGESGSGGHITVSPGAYRSLGDRWAFASPGVQEIAGRGQMRTYLLEGPAS